MMRIAHNLQAKPFVKLVSFIDLIEKLQKKPRHVRVRIMWVVVVICMSFILVFWIWSLGRQTATLAQPDEKARNLMGEFSQIREDIPSLWHSLGAGIGNIFQSFKQADNQTGENGPEIIPGSETPSTPSETLPLE